MSPPAWVCTPEQLRLERRHTLPVTEALGFPLLHDWLCLVPYQPPRQEVQHHCLQPTQEPLLSSFQKQL